MCRRVQAGRQTCRFLRERESHQDGFLVVGQKAVLVVVHGQLKEGTEDEVWQKVDDSDGEILTFVQSGKQLCESPGRYLPQSKSRICSSVSYGK